jgi:rod shape-determining protein MreC
VVVHRQDHRRRLTLVLLIITSLLLITLDERGSSVLDSVRTAAQDVVSPLQTVLDDALQPAVDFFDSFGRADELEAENAQLRDANTRLRVEVETGKAAAAENEDLRAALDIPQIADFDAVAANVVSGSVDNFSRTWRVDKGSSSGLAVGLPVAVGGDSAAALVGEVVATSANSATIRRIDDRNFGAGAQLVNPDGSGGELGEVGGVPNSRLLALDFFNTSLSTGVAIQKGQLVQTTTNLKSKFPPGLVIGTVVRSVPATSAQRSARVQPLVDLDSIDIVKILRSPPVDG